MEVMFRILGSYLSVFPISLGFVAFPLNFFSCFLRTGLFSYNITTRKNHPPIILIPKIPDKFLGCVQALIYNRSCAIHVTVIILLVVVLLLLGQREEADQSMEEDEEDENKRL